MHLLRNLGRRKLRTALTITGITIGIWALVVFSSMANKINSLVEGGSRYFADKVLVTDATGGGFANLPLRIALADAVAAVDGVDVVDPQVSFFYDLELGGFGQPAQVVGARPGGDKGRETFRLIPAQGRLLEQEDEGRNVVVLGSDLARREAAIVGGTVDIRDEAFEVVGILEPTLTQPDLSAFVPFAAGQRLYHADLPAIVRDELAAEELVSELIVYPLPGEDPDVVADRIDATVPTVRTLTGRQFDEQVGSATAIFNAIIVGVALISLVVGGLSVINTMAMSVAERTREIGIKRAIGGSRRRIIRELMAEAGMIGLIGGLLGLGLGAVVVYVANEAGRAGGTVLFELTPSTAGFAVLFSTILGVIAGVIPAWNAARLDPVEALRYE